VANENIWDFDCNEAIPVTGIEGVPGTEGERGTSGDPSDSQGAAGPDPTFDSIELNEFIATEAEQCMY
jgi:hypothetical protein